MVKRPILSESAKKIFKLGECQDYAVALFHLNGGDLIYVRDNDYNELLHCLLRVDSVFYDVSVDLDKFELRPYLEDEFFAEDFTILRRDSALRGLSRFYDGFDFTNLADFVNFLDHKIAKLTNFGKVETASALRELRQNFN